MYIVNLNINRLFTGIEVAPDTDYRDIDMKEFIHRYLRDSSRLLRALSAFMWTMICLSCGAVVFTIFQEAFYCNLSLTAKGIAYFLSMFEPFRHLFSGTIMLMTIYVALASYTRSKKIEAIKALQDLRSMLMEKDNVRIHDLLEYEEDDTSEKEKKLNDFKNEFANRQGCVYNYLGILELSKLYLDEGIISIEQFNDQFGYRVENIYANPLICKWINESHHYWRTLDSLKQLIQKQNSL